MRLIMSRLLGIMRGIFLREPDPSSVVYRILPPAVLTLLDRWSSPPAGDSYHGERAKQYDSVRTQQASWHAEQEGVAEALRGLKNIGEVLDIPVGTGRFFRFYKDMGMQVTGLDVSKEMLSEARHLATSIGLNPTLVSGDAKKTNFLDASFDLVVCFRFLHSIIALGEAREVIRELARVSRKYALIELGFRESAEPRRFRPSEKAAMRDKLSKEEVIVMLRDSGLSVLKIFGPFQEGGKSQYAFLCERV